MLGRLGIRLHNGPIHALRHWFRTDMINTQTPTDVGKSLTDCMQNQFCKNDKLMDFKVSFSPGKTFDFAPEQVLMRLNCLSIRYHRYHPWRPDRPTSRLIHKRTHIALTWPTANSAPLRLHWHLHRTEQHPLAFVTLRHVVQHLLAFVKLRHGVQHWFSFETVTPWNTTFNSICTLSNSTILINICSTKPWSKIYITSCTTCNSTP